MGRRSMRNAGKLHGGRTHNLCNGIHAYRNVTSVCMLTTECLAKASRVSG